MNYTIKFNKKKIIFGIIFVLILLYFSIRFIITPKIFIRNFLMKEHHIIIFGLISGIFFILLLFSFIKIFLRETALIINDTYLMDMSKYEALGKIYWNDITKIQRIKKGSLQLTFKKSFIEKKKIFFIKKLLLFMQNWDYKNSIIISSALLECDIDYLEHKILNGYNNYKNSKDNIS